MTNNADLPSAARHIVATLESIFLGTGKSVSQRFPGARRVLKLDRLLSSTIPEQ
jgi:hypothetical protein